MKLSHRLIFSSVVYCLTCFSVKAAQHFHFNLQDCNDSFATYGAYMCGVLFHSKEIGSWPISYGEFHAPFFAAFPPGNLHAIVYRDHRALGMRPEVVRGYVQVGFRFNLASLQVTTAGIPGVTLPGPQADLMNFYDNKPVYFFHQIQQTPPLPFEVDEHTKMASQVSRCREAEQELPIAMICFYRDLTRKEYELEQQTAGKFSLKEKIIRLPFIDSLMKMIEKQ